LILLSLSLGLSFALAQAAKEKNIKPLENKSQTSKTEAREHKLAADANSAPDANAAADPNMVVDSNQVVTEEDEFKQAVKEDLENVAKAGRKEAYMWKLSKPENKSKLAQTVQEQIVGELNFIREFAVEEGAAKTVMAIDVLLEDRDQRYKQVIEKLEVDEKKMRERDERRERRENKPPSRTRRTRQSP